MTGAPVAILQLLGQCGFCRHRRQGQELDAANAEPVESPETLVQASRERPGTVSQPARRRIVGANDGLAPGELVLERYRLLECLGAGGFGVVWRARDELLHREVAVKRIWQGAGGGPIDGERASREALATARLSHPAIVALYEACPQEGAFYLISELVDGDTLARLIEQDELADEEIVEIGAALASALTHAHARGVIHRDIKPQNVLVPACSAEHAAQTPQNLLAAAKLTDFGGASLVGEEALTRTGDVLGTLAYMAPEQSEGREVGVEADLYSLALVLYEALCGFNPVRGATPAATVRRIGHPLPALARARRDLPDELTFALDRALAPAPEDRGTLGELRDALENTLERGLRRSRWRRTATITRRADARDSHARILPRSVEPHWPARGLRDLPPAATELDPRLAELDSAEGARRAIWLPRSVWFASAGALVGWQLFVGRPGVALLLLAALAPPLLIGAARADSRLGVGWLAAALAPALGVVGLAGAFPAVAGQASCWRMRAALGVLGYWWLTLAGPLLGHKLWLEEPHGTPRHSVWEGSLSLAATHVIAPVLAIGVLSGALLWGVAAVVLPLLVRGYSAVRDVAAVAAWSAALVVATPVLAAGLNAHAAHPSPRGALLGAVLGAFVAVAARAVRGPV
ncbi:MAG TPA: serine/threonine-protein kinase [Solirubrobacteraceae bacterium]|jgi:serine/threonine protein kinase|nr:serine/threonine-protein kinase [Solirubrobacteraceae bacterium]